MFHLVPLLVCSCLYTTPSLDLAWPRCLMQTSSRYLSIFKKKTQFMLWQCIDRNRFSGAFWVTVYTSLKFRSHSCNLFCASYGHAYCGTETCAFRMNLASKIISSHFKKTFLVTWKACEMPQMFSISTEATVPLAEAAQQLAGPKPERASSYRKLKRERSTPLPRQHLPTVPLLNFTVNNVPSRLFL